MKVYIAIFAGCLPFSFLASNDWMVALMLNSILSYILYAIFRVKKTDPEILARIKKAEKKLKDIEDECS